MASPAKIASIDVDQPEEDLRRLTHTQRALRRLRKDYLTLVAMAAILFFALSSFGASWYAPILGLDAEQENLRKKFYLPDYVDVYSSLAVMGGQWYSSVANIDSHQDYINNHLLPEFNRTESVNILGTDDKGRDHLARLLYGGQVSLSIAFAAAILSIIIGVSAGIFTGYYGGVVDDFMMWFITTLNSIPSLFLLLIVSSVFREVEIFGVRGSSPVIFIGILGLLGWTGTMRLVRGETLGLREREYIVAARAMGASDSRIMFSHIFPNLISIVVVNLAIDIGVLILVESGLSFLGFGINPPTPTWGNMLTESQQFFRDAPHLVFAPGLLITITVLSLYVIGDGLRDALDPTSVD